MAKPKQVIEINRALHSDLLSAGVMTTLVDVAIEGSRDPFQLSTIKGKLGATATEWNDTITGLVAGGFVVLEDGNGNELDPADLSVISIQRLAVVVANVQPALVENKQAVTKPYDNRKDGGFDEVQLEEGWVRAEVMYVPLADVYQLDAWVMNGNEKGAYVLRMLTFDTMLEAWHWFDEWSEFDAGAENAESDTENFLDWLRNLKASDEGWIYLNGLEFDHLAEIGTKPHDGIVIRDFRTTDPLNPHFEYAGSRYAKSGNGHRWPAYYTIDPKDLKGEPVDAREIEEPEGLHEVSAEEVEEEEPQDQTKPVTSLQFMLKDGPRVFGTYTPNVVRGVSRFFLSGPFNEAGTITKEVTNANVKKAGGYEAYAIALAEDLRKEFLKWKN